MQYRIFSLLMILAMVVGLCVVAAVPVVGVAGSSDSVTLTNVTITPNKANKPARYEIAFTTSNSGALTASVDTVSITFPPETQMPSSIDPGEVMVNGIACDSTSYGGDAYLVGHTLIITVPQNINAGASCTVVIRQGAGIVNPQISQERNNGLHPAIDALNVFLNLHADTAPDELYELQVISASDPIASGTEIEIFDWIEMDPTDFPGMKVVIVTGAGFSPGSALFLNGLTGGPVAGSGTVDEDGTFTVYAVSSAAPPFVPLEARDGSGRVGERIWAKNSLMTDSVWTVSLSMAIIQHLPVSIIHPEGVFRVLPSLNVSPSSGLPGSSITLTGNNWGGTISATNIKIAGEPLNQGTPVLTDLDGDCNCMPAVFLTPGLMDIQMYIGGDTTYPASGTEVYSCDEVAQPVGGLGCWDDFEMQVTIPRMANPGKQDITVYGGDQLSLLHVAYEGTLTIPGVGTLPIAGEGNTALNQLECFLWVLNPALPALLEGMYGIDLPDCAGGYNTVSSSFEVAPRSVSVEPQSAAPGSTVTITGEGFVPGEPDSFNSGAGFAHNLGGIAVLNYGNSGKTGTLTANIEVADDGTFTAIGTIPEDAPEGDYAVTVFFDPTDTNYEGDSDAEGDEVVGQATFGLGSRALQVVPASGPYGTKITVSGGDFGSTALTPDLFVGTTDPDVALTLSTAGDVTPKTVNVTSTNGFAVGENTVKVTCDVGGSTVSASSAFEVTRPVIELDKAEGMRGSQIVLTGSGWLPGQLNFVSIKTDKGDGSAYSSWSTTLAVPTPDANGEIWASFTIPTSITVTGSEKTIRIKAADNNGNETIMTTFVVQRAQVSVDPESAAAGEAVTISGVGFQPQVAVQYVKIGGANVVRTDDLPITDSEGAFTVTGTVPGLEAGGHLVKAKVMDEADGGAGEITCSFTISAASTGDTSVENGLSTIDGKYDKIWTFDGATQEWQVYDTADGAPKEFTTLVKGRGYWVQVSEDCALTFGANTYNLSQGWNLIGWLG